MVFMVAEQVAGREGERVEIFYQRARRIMLHLTVAEIRKALNFSDISA